jgi:hypothetical protein
MELQPYLKAEYADEILECTICMEIITKVHFCTSLKLGQF